MRNALQFALKSGKISKDQAKQLEKEGDSRITSLKDAMSGSKGMSKEQQKDLLPQLNKLRGNIEDLIPGTERETAKAQLSGAGKYEKAIDSFVSTGRGGGRKRKPEEVSGTNQRMRLGKGTTQTKEGPVQRPVTSTGDMKPPTTGDPSTFPSFSKQASTFIKGLKTAEVQRQQVQRELETNSDGSQSYLQHRRQKIINNPDLNARLTAADIGIATAQKNFMDFHAKAQVAKKPESKPEPEPQRTEPVDPKPTSTTVQKPVPNKLNDKDKDKEKEKKLLDYVNK
jgi:hypothetical protein